MEFSVRAAELASLLESRISNFVTSFQLDEIGRVVSVGDGIARIYGLKEIQVVELAPILISLVISLLVSLIPLGLLFCRNSLIAPYEFTMEKVLFVVRSLKEKLVINLESLLLHGNEDFREKRLKREEIRRKSQNKAHMTRRANPISGGMFNVLFRIWIVLFLLFSVFTVCSLVLGFDLSLIWVKLQSMLLLRSFRFLFSRLLGWEAPLILLCLVAGLGGSSTLHMQDPAGGQPAANPAAEQPSNVPSGASTSGGWTRFDEDVLLEADSGASSSGHSNSNPSINQPRPGEQAMPLAIPVAAGEAEAGPSHVVPFPYDEEEVIGGDSVLSIQNRLLGHNPNPSAESLYFARLDAQDRFELKVEVIEGMATLDPTGDWLNRGARALDNPRASSGEPSLEELSRMRDDLNANGRHSATFHRLKEKVFLRKENLDDESQA